MVEVLQMPAWVERDGARVPVARGPALQPNDGPRTGANARLLLKLAEGSSVKLGESAQRRLAQVQVRKDNVFAASRRVPGGAFRFTTGVLATAHRREVAINVATVTAGIRGTDLWGEAAAGRDIVCLIEGRIEVTHPGDPAVTVDQPLSFYVAPRGRPALPVQPLKDEQLKRRGRRDRDRGGQGGRGGRGKVVLASGESENEVLRVYPDVLAAGDAAEVDPKKVQGRRVYEVRIAQLRANAEAEARAAALAGKHGVTSPRVTQ